MYHFEDILIALIFILAHFLLFLFNYRVYGKKILHPAVLFSLIWFIIIALHWFFSFTVLNELPPLRISTYLIFFIGAISFSLGSYTETAVQKKYFVNQNLNYASLDNSEINLKVIYVLLGIALIGLPFFLIASYKIFIASNVDSFFIGLRSELLYGDADIGVLKYLFPFSLVVYSFSLRNSLINKNRINKILLFVSFLLTLTYAVFTTGRLIFLIILVVYLGMRFIYGKNFSVKTVLRFAFFFMLVFIGLGIVYKKGGTSEETFRNNVNPAIEGTAIYMVVSLNALDKKLHNQFRVNYDGNNTFRFFIKLGKEFGLFHQAKVNDLIPPFTFTPYPTNVYTIYSSYIEDYGYFYAWFIMALLGFLQSFLFNKAIRTWDLRYSFYYSILLYPLLISFFADQYFSLISFWVQFAVIVEVIILLNKFFNKRKLKFSIS